MEEVGPREITLGIPSDEDFRSQHLKPIVVLGNDFMDDEFMKRDNLVYMCRQTIRDIRGNQSRVNAREIDEGISVNFNRKTFVIQKNAHTPPIIEAVLQACESELRSKIDYEIRQEGNYYRCYVRLDDNDNFLMTMLKESAPAAFHCAQTYLVDCLITRIHELEGLNSDETRQVELAIKAIMDNRSVLGKSHVVVTRTKSRQMSVNHTAGSMLQISLILTLFVCGIQSLSCVDRTGMGGVNFFNCSVPDQVIEHCIYPKIGESVELLNARNLAQFKAHIDNRRNIPDSCNGTMPYLSGGLSGKVYLDMSKSLGIDCKVVNNLNYKLQECMQDLCKMLEIDTCRKLDVENGEPCPINEPILYCYNETSKQKIAKRDYYPKKGKVIRNYLKRDINLEYQLADSIKVLMSGSRFAIINVNEDLINFIITKGGITNKWVLKGHLKYYIDIPSEFLADTTDINYVITDPTGTQLKIGILPISIDHLKAVAKIEAWNLFNDMLEKHKVWLILMVLLFLYLYSLLYRWSSICRVMTDNLIAVLLMPVRLMYSLMMSMFIIPMYNTMNTYYPENRIWRFFDYYIFYNLRAAQNPCEESGSKVYSLNGVKKATNDDHIVIDNQHVKVEHGDEFYLSLGYWKKRNNGKVSILFLVYVTMFMCLLTGAAANPIGNNGDGVCSNAIALVGTATSCNLVDKFCEFDTVIDTKMIVGGTTCFTITDNQPAANITMHVSMTGFEKSFTSFLALEYATGSIDSIITNSRYNCPHVFGSNPDCSNSNIALMEASQDLEPLYGELTPDSSYYPTVFGTTPAPGCAWNGGCFACGTGCMHSEAIMTIHSYFVDVMKRESFKPEFELHLQHKRKEDIGNGEGSEYEKFVLTGDMQTYTNGDTTIDYELHEAGLADKAEQVFNDYLLDVKHYLVKEGLDPNYPAIMTFPPKDLAICNKDQPILGSIGELQLFGAFQFGVMPNRKIAEGFIKPRWTFGSDPQANWEISQVLTDRKIEELIAKYKEGNTIGNYNFKEYDRFANKLVVTENFPEAVPIRIRIRGAQAITISYADACPNAVSLNFAGEGIKIHGARMLLKASSTCEGGNAHVRVENDGANTTIYDYTIVLQESVTEFDLPFTAGHPVENFCAIVSTARGESKVCGTGYFNATTSESLNTQHSFGTANNTVVNDDTGILEDAFGWLDVGNTTVNNILRVAFIVAICIGGVIAIIIVLKVLSLIVRIAPGMEKVKDR